MGEGRALMWQGEAWPDLWCGSWDAEEWLSWEWCRLFEAWMPRP